MKHKNINGNRLIICMILFTMLHHSCKKFTELPAPDNSLNSANVYTNDVTAAAVLTGIYTKMSMNNMDFDNGSIGFSNISLAVLPGLSGDELTLFNIANVFYGSYYQNALTSNTNSNSFWESIYPVILNCNLAIEGLQKSSSLTPAVKQQLLGEARFMRAFCYFYLVNLYGNVPLVLTSDATANVQLGRTDKALVYQQMTTDLIEAKSLLSEKYVESDGLTTKANTGRLRPNKWAASALLARVYLYAGDHANAEAEATAVISNIAMFSLVPLNNVFLMNSKEAIWQLQPVGNFIYTNSAEGRIFILDAGGPNDYSNHQLYLSSTQVNSFEPGDLRKTNWTSNVTVGTMTYYYPYKYKVGEDFVNPPQTSEYMMVLRLAEQYLIRAEARAKLGNVSGAVADLNTLRARARGVMPGDLPALASTLSPQQALDAVLHERQLELFTEWGHRWLDLKRTGKIDAAMTAAMIEKGGVWNSNWALYPVPRTELERAPKLTQNPGYQ